MLVLFKAKKGWCAMAKRKKRPATKESGADLLFLINEFRAEKGLARIEGDPVLDMRARAHAVWMNRFDMLSHEGFASRSEGYLSAAENVAWGYISAEAIALMWEGSIPHRHNLLGDYAVCGIGQDGLYWCVIFGNLKK